MHTAPCIILYLFNIYFGLHWIFIAARGLSLVAESGVYSLVAVSHSVASLVGVHSL